MEKYEYFMYYHGTSDFLKITNGYILPAIETDILREEYRKDKLDVVFTTKSLISARRYAVLASKKYGGNPVVYKVKPIQSYYSHNGEYLCEKARIIDIVE